MKKIICTGLILLVNIVCFAAQEPVKTQLKASPDNASRQLASSSGSIAISPKKQSGKRNSGGSSSGSPDHVYPWIGEDRNSQLPSNKKK